MRASMTFLFVALTTAAVKADTFTVNDTNDAVDANPGDMVCATADGTCTLRAAIQEANALAGTDEIEIPAGTFFLTLVGAGEDLAATGDLDITEAIEIRGAGADQTIIDGLIADRIFDSILGVSVSLQDLTLTSGYVGTDLGGAIRHPGPGDLSLQNVTALHNQAVNGGAVHHMTGTLTIINSRFERNIASTNGGAVFYMGSGDIEIQGSLLRDNFAFVGGGGGCYLANGNSLTVTATDFEDNWALGGGGGLIFTGPGDVEITDSSFLRNISISEGGALNVNTAAGFTTANTQFEENTSVAEGGAIFILAMNDIAISDSTFVENTASAVGGGAYLISAAGGLSLTATRFHDNSAGTSAGGLYFDGIDDASMLDCSFLRNTSRQSAGGAMIEADAGMTVATTQFEDNRCGGYAGGLWFVGLIDLNISDSLFSNNKALSTAGGCYSFNNGTVTISRCLFVDNEAGDGGGLFCDTGVVANVENTTFSGNRTEGRGGAVFAAQNMNFVNVTFAHNLSLTSGGGIYNLGFTVNLTNTILVAGIAGPNCEGAVTSLGGNISNDSSCALMGTADQDNADPLIGPLADNGGLTMTHALLVGSPAIDGGRSAPCPGDDQRGIERPFDGDGDGVAACDIGAFESSTDCDDNGVDDLADVGAGDGTDCDDNGVLDACEYEDSDDDGIPDPCDECTDTDGDGFGDPGFPSNTCTEDNCPTIANADQADSDGNGIGDACQDCCGGATPMAMPFMLMGWSFARIRRRGKKR